jgi:hypothetical protein
MRKVREDEFSFQMFWRSTYWRNVCIKLAWARLIGQLAVISQLFCAIDLSIPAVSHSSFKASRPCLAALNNHGAENCLHTLMARAALSSTVFSFAPNTGGRATTAVN